MDWCGFWMEVVEGFLGNWFLELWECVGLCLLGGLVVRGG